MGEDGQPKMEKLKLAESTIRYILDQLKAQGSIVEEQLDPNDPASMELAQMLNQGNSQPGEATDPALQGEIGQAGQPPIGA